MTTAEINKLWRPRYDGPPVFAGDSITAGTGASDAAHRWVNLVCANKGWTNFINSGAGGACLQNTAQNTTAILGGAATGNGQDSYPTKISAFSPAYVFCLYGYGDGNWNEAGFTTALFKAAYLQVVNAIVAHGTPAGRIIIGSPSYVQSYTAKHAANVVAASQVASEIGTKYADIFQAMVDGGGDDLLAVDNVHPNDTGHALIASAFLAAVPDWV